MSMQGRFTQKAGKVLALARDEAKGFNHDYIGTEHMLLGLVKETQGEREQASNTAIEVLAELGIGPNRIREEVSKLVVPGSPTIVSSNLVFTPLAEKAIEFAMEEARAMGHGYVGTEHLLLGLLRQEPGRNEQSVAFLVLYSLGLNEDMVREKTKEILGIADAGRQSRIELERVRGQVELTPEAGLEMSISELLDCAEFIMRESENQHARIRCFQSDTEKAGYNALKALYMQGKAIAKLLEKIEENTRRQR